ncbi:hypothetical protein ACPC54_27375 [Kitasatospora sp. NPDC094028]
MTTDPGLPRRKPGTHWQEPPERPSGAFLPQGPVLRRPNPRTVAHRTAGFLQHLPQRRWLSVAEAFDTPSAVRSTRDGR